MVNAIRLITAKRDGLALEREEIVGLIESYTSGLVPDYQMSAFLMAAYLRGMNETETAALTESMLKSGATMGRGNSAAPRVDKHSTGGVGDKISLIVAPTAAACGVCVPMITGRGLGHTGGTQDKLSAIPGFRTDLSTKECSSQLDRIGAVITAQTDEIAPADRRMYALRDVTVTVDFIPFIAASIMSKKLAEDIDALVLDVKTGRGAFMATETDARQLAKMLVNIGERFGTTSIAWLTRMDIPLGRAVGNWIEVQESIRCLQGDGEPDVMKVSLTLAGEMIYQAGHASSAEDGLEKAQRTIDSGAALQKFVDIVEAQGGHAESLFQPPNMQVAAKVHAPATAKGFVSHIDALILGLTACQMGVGRSVKEEDVDPMSGIILHKKPGEPVTGDCLLASLHTQRKRQVRRFIAAIQGSFSYSEVPPELPPVIIDRLDRSGWMSNGTAPQQSQ